MPLVDINEVKAPKIEATGRAVPMELKTALVQSRFQPLQSLITQISGSIYVVEYYTQLLGSNDAPKPLQVELDAPYQQYDLIRQLEIRLQGELSYSQNDDDKNQVVTGEAILYPGLIPNEGDMFLADVGQNRRGIFAVTNTSRLSYYKQTCYRIMFSLVAFADNDAPRMESLTKKVVAVRHFVKDFMRQGKNPVIIDDLYSDYRELTRVQDTMVTEYLRLFFSEVSQTLLIPGQETNCYDPFLVSAVLSVLETTQSPLLRKVSAHNLDAQYAFRTTTIWDALLQVEPSHVHLACQQMGLVSKTVVRSRAQFGGVYWSKIDHVMYPIEAREDADAHRTFNPYVSPESLDHGPAPVRDFFRLIPTKNTVPVQVVDVRPPEETIKNIHNVADDPYYVFSQAFYQNDSENMSALEIMVWSVLNQNDVDVPKLAELVRQSKLWDKLERFYYIPVLMVLCTLALRGPSSM